MSTINPDIVCPQLQKQIDELKNEQKALQAKIEILANLLKREIEADEAKKPEANINKTANVPKPKVTKKKKSKG